MTKDHNGWPYTVDTNGERVFKVTRSFDTSQAAWLFMKRQNIITRYLAAIKKHNEGWVHAGIGQYALHYYYIPYGREESIDCIHFGGEVWLKPVEWRINPEDGVANKVAAEFTDAEMKLILTGSE